MEYLYTLICNFRDGTYFSQVRAADHIQAVNKWAIKFKQDQPIQEFSKQVAESILSENHDPENAVAIAGLSNVWCNTALYEDDLVLLDVIKTEPN